MNFNFTKTWNTKSEKKNRRRQLCRKLKNMEVK